jgi:hypothetical protein
MINSKLMSVVTSGALAAALLTAAGSSEAAGCKRTRSAPTSTSTNRFTQCTDGTASAEVNFLSTLQTSKSYQLIARLINSSAISTSTKLLNGAGADIAGCFISDGSVADGSKQSTCIVPNTNPAVNYKLTAGNGPVE